LWEQRHAMAALRERGRQAVDEQMLFDAVTAQRLLVDEAFVKTKSARRAFQRTAYAVAGAEPQAASETIEYQENARDRVGEISVDVTALPFEVEEWT
jgi:putative transposase